MTTAPIASKPCPAPRASASRPCSRPAVAASQLRSRTSRPVAPRVWEARGGSSAPGIALCAHGEGGWRSSWAGKVGKPVSATPRPKASETPDAPATRFSSRRRARAIASSLRQMSAGAIGSDLSLALTGSHASNLCPTVPVPASRPYRPPLAPALRLRPAPTVADARLAPASAVAIRSRLGPTPADLEFSCFDLRRRDRFTAEPLEWPAWHALASARRS
jgi:hypothetical protein